MESSHKHTSRRILGVPLCSLQAFSSKKCSIIDKSLQQLGISVAEVTMKDTIFNTCDVDSQSKLQHSLTTSNNVSNDSITATLRDFEHLKFISQSKNLNILDEGVEFNTNLDKVQNSYTKFKTNVIEHDTDNYRAEKEPMHPKRNLEQMAFQDDDNIAFSTKKKCSSLSSPSVPKNEKVKIFSNLTRTLYNTINMSTSPDQNQTKNNTPQAAIFSTSKQRNNTPAMLSSSRNSEKKMQTILKRNTVHIIDAFLWEKKKTENSGRIFEVLSELNSSYLQSSISFGNNTDYNTHLLISRSTDRLHKSIVDMALRRSYLRRSNSRSTLTTPSVSHVDLANGSTLYPLRTLGKGSFGYAVLADLKSISFPNSEPTEKGYNTRKVVLKIGYDVVHILYEALVHLVIRERLYKYHLENSMILQAYSDHFMPPFAVQSFSNTAFLAMEYAPLGTLVDAINCLISVDTDQVALQERQSISAILLIQMMKAIMCLHSNSIIHADIKTDNWVLKRHPKTHQLLVVLIDFGKAKDLSIKPDSIYRRVFCTLTENASKFSTPKTSESMENRATSFRKATEGMNIDSSSSGTIGFTSNASAKNFSCREMLEHRPWTYQADYYGICACFHNLLFLDELSVEKETDNNSILSRGFDEIITKSIRETFGTSQHNILYYPKVTLKRFWNRSMWTYIYLKLLNHKKLSVPLPIDSIINKIQVFLDTTIKSSEQTTAVSRLITGLESRLR